MSQSFSWHGMDLEVEYDEEGTIESVANQDCVNFEEHLSDNYIDLLQDDFVDYMINKAKFEC